MMIDELNLVHDYTSRVDYVANLLSRCMHACARVHNPGREVRFSGKFPVPGTVRDAFPGPGLWFPGLQIQKSKSQIFWSKTNPGITVAVM